MTSQPSNTPQTAERSGLVDGCGRRIDYLRLSVTSACDLRCIYCRPATETVCMGKPTLTDRQRVDFIRFLHDRYGLVQVRFTGGEPLLYRDIVSLVAEVRRAVPELELVMTTNGQWLYQKGFELFTVGLNRLNVSLDTLNPARHRAITGGQLEPVLEGLQSARFVGFPPPKINTVVLRGVNDDEIADLTMWAWSKGSEIRFLEAMPIGPAADANRRGFVSGAEIRANLAEQFQLEPIPGAPGDTARRFHGSCDYCSGVVGMISPVTEPFCAGCRRMRLTSDGRLFPCLLDGRSVDISAAWETGRFSTSTADMLVRAAVAGKQPQGNRQHVAMIALGG